LKETDSKKSFQPFQPLEPFEQLTAQAVGTVQAAETVLYSNADSAIKRE
jgi:hypothetical protein